MVTQQQKFTGVPVVLDGKTFTGCIFVKCTLMFSGLLPVYLDSCTFDSCQWEFSGPAANTLTFMSAMYHHTGAVELIERTFESIRRGGSEPRRTGDAVILN